MEKQTKTQNRKIGSSTIVITDCVTVTVTVTPNKATFIMIDLKNTHFSLTLSKSDIYDLREELRGIKSDNATLNENWNSLHLNTLNSQNHGIDTILHSFYENWGDFAPNSSLDSSNIPIF